jgi:hypothetical protein
VFALSVAVLVACAGRPAKPVMVYQPADAQRSCDSLEWELAIIEEQIVILIPKADKTGTNAALGISGMLLLVPLFFMDLSKAEQVEINALSKRHNHLLEISEDKTCGLMRQPLLPDLR